MLEGGAFIGGRAGGHLFWLDKDTPTDFVINDGAIRKLFSDSKYYRKSVRCKL